jgi:hypothetical protein
LIGIVAPSGASLIQIDMVGGAFCAKVIGAAPISAWRSRRTRTIHARPGAFRPQTLPAYRLDTDLPMTP